MISAQSLIDCFRLALSEKWGYIWGTSGEIWSVEKQRALEKTTDPDRAQGRMYGNRWIGRKVADCSGLFTWAFRRLGGTMYHGSNTMYLKWCAAKGKLTNGHRTDGQTLKPGTAVFTYNEKKSNCGPKLFDDNVVVEVEQVSRQSSIERKMTNVFQVRLTIVLQEDGTFCQLSHAPYVLRINILPFTNCCYTIHNIAFHTFSCRFDVTG